MIGKEIFFFYKALIFGLGALILIPKSQYKKFFTYGLIFGGTGDVLVALVFGKMLRLFYYSDMGVFNVLNLFSFWTPWAWIFTFTFFLYLLPTQKIFIGIYLVAFSFFGHTVGLTLENMGLFHYGASYRYLAPIIYFSWFSFSAWAYLRLENFRLH